MAEELKEASMRMFLLELYINIYNLTSIFILVKMKVFEINKRRGKGFLNKSGGEGWIFFLKLISGGVYSGGKIIFYIENKKRRMLLVPKVRLASS